MNEFRLYQHLFFILLYNLRGNAVWTETDRDPVQDLSAGIITETYISSVLVLAPKVEPRKLRHFLQVAKAWSFKWIWCRFSSVKPFQETVLSSIIVYFVRTEIQKPLIPDTSVPQAYVTQQQHPHSSVFLDVKS